VHRFEIFSKGYLVIHKQIKKTQKLNTSWFFIQGFRTSLPNQAQGGSCMLSWTKKKRQTSFFIKDRHSVSTRRLRRPQLNLWKKQKLPFKIKQIPWNAPTRNPFAKTTKRPSTKKTLKQLFRIIISKITKDKNDRSELISQNFYECQTNFILERQLAG